MRLEDYISTLPPICPLVRVRYEEHIVGILFTLIAAFLRCLHTSTLQPSTGVPVHGRYPHCNYALRGVLFCTVSASSSRLSLHFYSAFIHRSTRLTILLPLRSCSLTKAVPLWSGSLKRPLPLRSCTLMWLTSLLQNPIPACAQTNLSWTSRLRIHSMSSL